MPHSHKARTLLQYNLTWHYDDVIMGATASQITSLTSVYSTVYSDADQRKHQSSASLAFVRGIHRRPVNSPHKWPVTREMFPFHDVVMWFQPSSLWLTYLITDLNELNQGLVYWITHRGHVTHLSVSLLGHHWFRKLSVASFVSSHYLNKCWLIIKWTFG